MRVAPLAIAPRETCRAILDDLPEWFGRPEANAAYARDAEHGPTLAAFEGDRPIGVAIHRRAFERTVDVHLLAVRRQAHGRGAGRALIEAMAVAARAQGARWLTVQTIGPSRLDPHYEATRRFYRAVGFDPIEEIVDFWGPGTPRLLMLRRV